MLDAARRDIKVPDKRAITVRLEAPGRGEWMRTQRRACVFCPLLDTRTEATRGR